MDPLLDVIRLLRPRATLWGGLQATGRWGLSFRQREDLLFAWVEQGECLLLRPRSEPVCLRPQDFFLIRTSTPFTLASDASADAVDSEDAVAAAKNARLVLGPGTSRPVVLHAGRFVFDTANEDLLASLLPPFVHLTAGEDSSDRVRALLGMNQVESRERRPAGEFIVVRLVELILVEILRTQGLRLDAQRSGLLAGLADPVTSRALSAIHQDVAHPWTVEALAKRCGVSRSSFATRFRTVVGTGPIDYLLHWRMAMAKDELRRGVLSIGEIAFAVGFQSSSAFSTSFTRAVGCSPTRFIATAASQT